MNAIQLHGITKRFGNFAANDNVSLDVPKGSIFALVGENGAGKSTLMKILYGLYAADAGEIFINEKKVDIASSADAIALGIGMVHQHFMLIGTLTVLENIILGKEGGFQLDFKKAAADIASLSKRFGLAINPNDKLADLSVGVEQRVEILKVLYRNADILILDEPTAVLTPLETEDLFKTLRLLRDEGKTIVIITHKLDEVLAVSDRVAVMRAGKLVATMLTSQTSKEDIARQMVGRDVLLRVEKSEAHPMQPVLEIKNLSYTSSKNVTMLNNLSLHINAAEIYGIAGVEGNGQSELLEFVTGLATASGFAATGDVLIDGTSVLNKTVKQVSTLGVSHIPEDRLKRAVITNYSIADNLIFGRHLEPSFSSGLSFNGQRLAENLDVQMQAYDIRCSSKTQAVKGLSGGNQQKLVIAREFTRPNLKLIVLAQPTRGVDIGAIEFIHRKIIEARDAGKAVLLVSAELEEVVSLSDRLGCIYKGRIVKEFSQADVTLGKTRLREFEREIGLYITGAKTS
jgi:ABC-type uncharacterized transport system ATPase subunit